MCADKPSILLVDDEIEILVALSDVFEDEYYVESTTNPQHALEILQKNTDISVILSDQRMPEMTGDVFLEKARHFSDARSILLTGYADLEAVVSALNNGKITAYVHKPWDRETLGFLVKEASQNCLSQRALQTEQALLQGLMRTLPFGLVFSDKDGKCIRSNRLSEGEQEIDLYNDELHSVVNEMRSSAYNKGYVEKLVEVSLAGEKQQKRWYEFTRVALEKPDFAASDKKWQVCISRDVTNRIIAEKRLKQAERFEALGCLAGGVAHDFNNLLGVFSGCLEMVARNLVSGREVAQKWIAHAEEAILKGEKLSQSLLQFGRSSSPSFEEIEIVSFIKDRLPLFRQCLHGARPSVCLRAEILLEECHVCSRADQLEMALLNLCVNARDALPQGGEIVLKLFLRAEALRSMPNEERKGDTLVIEVIDKGTGIPYAIQSQVFDPFFTTKEAGKGSGFGLASVYNFMMKSEGEVEIDSMPGKGTCVRLLFPLDR